MKSIAEIRRDFPILERKIGGNPLVYFDNGATCQKPQQVIDSIVEYYTTYNANIHRGVHTLSQEATEAYETARKKLQKHINAAKPYEVLFRGNQLGSYLPDPFCKGRRRDLGTDH